MSNEDTADTMEIGEAAPTPATAKNQKNGIGASAVRNTNRFRKARAAHAAVDRAWQRVKKSAKKQGHVIRNNPSIAGIPFLVFVILCASGLTVSFVLFQAGEERLRGEALLLARETGQFFSSQLDNAILPVFSMAQFVTELDIFHDLPDQIGDAGEPGSRPMLPPKVAEGANTHRNVTNVCDDPALVHKFDQIAGTIKKNAKMDGVLVNLQLAPQAVVCLLHPMINTEDFPSGIVMDNTGAVGHDLLTDPDRKFIAEATIPSQKVVVAGPLPLRQCQDCHPTVEKAFIARVAITSEDHEIEINGVAYPKWGFAVGLINWEALVERSGVYEKFEEQRFGFKLTRTDRKYDEETGTFNEKVVILAETADFEETAVSIVSTALETTNNEWEISVAYRSVHDLNWKSWIVAFTIVVSFFISILIYTILMQKQMHADVIARQARLLLENARQAAKDARELNDFISHEVRNPLSAALSACSFVSSAVHEKEPLVTTDSQKAVREDVLIIDRSLHFVNDLLRNMLDMQRAAGKQLTIELDAAAVSTDILETVASMLYRRNDTFDVIVECPERLHVMTDRLRLKQVLLNLGRNAAKFVQQGFVRLRAEVVENNVYLFVEDSGPGIPVEKRTKLFAKFQDSLDSLSQGTGVGLSLVNTLVNLMGGEVYLDKSYHSGIENCPGARFVIDLNTAPIVHELVDVSDNETCDTYESTDQDHTGDLVSNTSQKQVRDLPQNMAVLIIDDDFILRKLLSRSIHKILPEWTIQEAANGETALRMVDSQQYDIIFLDQYMTSVERQLLGTETCRELRSKGVSSIICGLSANDLENTFLEAGANFFSLKPFPCKPDELRRELLRIVGG